MLTETQRALLAFIGTSGRPPEELTQFGADDSDLQALVAAGYVVLNGAGLDAGTDSDTGSAPQSVLTYALTYAGSFEIPQS